MWCRDTTTLHHNFTHLQAKSVHDKYCFCPELPVLTATMLNVLNISFIGLICKQFNDKTAMSSTDIETLNFWWFLKSERTSLLFSDSE